VVVDWRRLAWRPTDQPQLERIGRTSASYQRASVV
jgi:hypothetical protein